MSLKEKLMADLKEAMKSKDMTKVNTLRMILTTLKNLEVEKMKEASDEEVMEALMKEAKKRREAIEEYEKHGRVDLAEKEKKELEIIESYLPKQLSEEEVREIVMDAIKEVGATSPKDLGKVMKLVMPKVKGRADGKLVNKMVREILESL
ncbi:GatB/YqeY domain-containing protein [Thermotoga sp. SG1]|uniref:GatB/YqeY domain-containing protein n=1 Tax=Thermotoga sp. SG1 TaxID=126739 RepID=UPI000C76F01E|nr:GatB/YqeY domain-containing protein [Thermotoga sp. SG1]PLV56808.1 glutamyl-tRNA amidotransferase [Thermotoga sp. SG1]